VAGKLSLSARNFNPHSPDGENVARDEVMRRRRRDFRRATFDVVDGCNASFSGVNVRKKNDERIRPAPGGVSELLDLEGLLFFFSARFSRALVLVRISYGNRTNGHVSYQFERLWLSATWLWRRCPRWPPCETKRNKRRDIQARMEPRAGPTRRLCWMTKEFKGNTACGCIRVGSPSRKCGDIGQVREPFLLPTRI
jgi:hypothetical protein